MIKRKLKECKRCGEDKYLFGHGMCEFCYNVTKLEKAKSSATSDKKMSLADKRVKALALFSTWRRMSTANDKGFCKCVTCGDKYHWKDIQNGHYIDREHNATTFKVINNHPQCQDCNEFKRGNIEKYREYLVQAYGEEVVSDLEASRYEVLRLTHPFLDDLIDVLNKRIEKLEKSLKKDK